jgi:peroxiredoxin Q/BCP
MQEYLTTSGKTAKIPDKEGRSTVLYFYPRDSTSGCTVEGLGFSAKFDEFTAVNTVIYGVSMDSMESHEEFKKEFDFPFELILDGDGKLCEEYGVLKPKNKDGLDYKGIARTTFLIDSGGEVVHQWDEVDVKNHAEDVLNVIKDLNK